MGLPDKKVTIDLISVKNVVERLLGQQMHSEVRPVFRRKLLPQFVFYNIVENIVTGDIQTFEKSAHSQFMGDLHGTAFSP